MNDDNILHIYTDGACKGNPGIGGWGALLCYGPHQKTLKSKRYAPSSAPAPSSSAPTAVT